MTLPRPANFATTRWSIIQAAAGRPTETAGEAMEELCATYWPPVYAFIRQRGASPADAEDQTQAFFVYILDSEFVHSADCRRGRFRSFLLKSVVHFLRDAHRALQTEKRGGKLQTLSLNFESGEQQYQSAVKDQVTAEQIFERRWALTLLTKVSKQLRDEYKERGQLLQFECLEAHINQDAARVPYVQLCEKLKMNEDAIKQAARRMKLRYREVLRTEIAGTVQSAGEVDDELRQLMRALAK